MKKYELLVDDTVTFFGVQLFRIKALISFSEIEKGEVGGYIASEKNLSQYGNAWVSGDARVSGNADYIVFKNTWSSSRYFTYTKSNKNWRVGCFYGSGAELVKKAYKDSKKSGDFYKAYVDFVEKLEEIENIHKEQ
nr:MAG TPA: Putative transferase, nesg, ydcK, Structural Genomics.38A [Caudoviricetes sp.]